MYLKLVRVADGHKRSFIMPLHSPLCKIYSTDWIGNLIFVYKTEDINCLNAIAALSSKAYNVDHYQLWQCQIKGPIRMARHIILPTVIPDIVQNYDNMIRSLEYSISLYDRFGKPKTDKKEDAESLIVRQVKLVRKVWDNYELVR